MRILAGVLLCFLIMACGKPVPENVDAARLREWVSFLASDEMKGRENGSPELEQAAEWLAVKLREAGVKPLPGQSDFFQRYESDTKEGKLSMTNVIGMIEGRNQDSKDEYLLLSAHYDHIGTNPELEGDTIFNGADDNASGVAAVLGIATSLGQHSKRPGRSVVFAFWSGEEMGLLGSKHYRANPILPLEKMVVNLNFELVGYSKTTGQNKMWVTGASYSNLMDLMTQIEPERGWTSSTDPFPDLNLFYRSDNATFAFLKVNREERTAIGIPAHTFSTWGNEPHYHKVDDEAEFLDYGNMAGLVGFMTLAVEHLAGPGIEIFWKEGTPFTLTRPEP